MSTKMSFGTSEPQETASHTKKEQKKDFSGAVSAYKQEIDKHQAAVSERAAEKPLSGVKLNATTETHVRKTFFIDPELNRLLKMHCVENNIDQGVLMNQIIRDWAVSAGKLKEGGKE